MKPVLDFKRRATRRLLALVVSMLITVSVLTALQLSVPAYAADPVWKGIVKASDSARHDMRNELAVAEFVLNGAQSSVSGTYTFRRQADNPWCTDGDLTTYEFSGTVSDPFPSLSLGIATEPLAAGGYYAWLSSDYGSSPVYTGNYSEQGCGFSSPNNDASYAVLPHYGPPTGCNDRWAIVPARTIQAIRTTRTSVCAIPNGDGSYIEGRSVWDYQVKLDPCDTTIDTDSDGMGDCAEFDIGRDPQNPADGGGTTPNPPVPPTAPDVDGDQVSDSIDNCPFVSNPLQTDSDGDGFGDACDADVILPPVDPVPPLPVDPVPPLPGADTANKAAAIVFVHGYKGTDSYSCNAWNSLKSHLKEKGFTGEFKTVGYYWFDRNCNFDISKLKDHDGGPQSNTSHGGPGHQQDTDIRHLAWHLAWALWDDKWSQNEPTNIVAHSMGGLVTRYMLWRIQMGDKNYPMRAYVPNAVTLGTPHRGTTRSVGLGGLIANDAQANQMLGNSGFLDSLNRNAPHPEGVGGTDWTVMSSEKDGIVSEFSGTNMDSDQRLHKIRYMGDPDVGHSGYYKFDDSKDIYRAYYRHLPAKWQRDTKFPSPVRMIAKAVGSSDW